LVVTVNDTVNFRLGFLLQTWADGVQDPISQGYSDNLFLRRVRLIMAGNLAKDVSFFFETENSRLGDAGTDGVKNINTGFHVLDAFGEWRVFGNDQFVDDIDHRKDSRRYMGGFNYYVAEQNFKITTAYERIVPNVVGRNHLEAEEHESFCRTVSVPLFLRNSGSRMEEPPAAQPASAADALGRR